MRRPGLETIVFGVITTFVLAFLMFPIVFVIPASVSGTGIDFPPTQIDFSGYARFASSPEWLAAMFLSARVAFLSTLVVLALGLAASLATVRGRFRGKQLFNTLVMAPLIIPTVVLGLALFFFFRQLGIHDTTVGLAVAHTVIALPIVVIVLSTGLKTFDENLEQAAMSLGAGRLRALRYVTLPLIVPSLVAAAVFAFIISFDELVVAIFVTGVGTETLPMKMFGAALHYLDPLLSVVSTILIFISIVAALLAYSAMSWRARRLRRSGANDATEMVRRG